MHAMSANNIHSWFDQNDAIGMETPKVHLIYDLCRYPSPAAAKEARMMAIPQSDYKPGGKRLLDRLRQGQLR